MQNQSRDWATDKFNITVGYDTDIDFARKLIKKIGLQLDRIRKKIPSGR